MAVNVTECCNCGDFATTAVGAFLDWGLTKDLLVPFREQKTPMQTGESYIVRVLVDEETNRIIASARLARHLDLTRPCWVPGDRVQLMIYGKTDLGYKAIIDGTHSGLLFANQVFQPLRPGEKLDGYIADVRRDGKIDLTLEAPAHERVRDFPPAHSCTPWIRSLRSSIPSTMAMPAVCWMRGDR